MSNSELFERDSKHSKCANSNYSKKIPSIQISKPRDLNHSKGIRSFECSFEPFESHSKHSNGNSNHSNGIRNIRMLIRTIRKGFEAFEFKLQTIRKRFEAFECTFKPFERDSKHSNGNLNHSKGIGSIRIQIQTIRKRFKHSNSNSNYSKKIRSIRMQH